MKPFRVTKCLGENIVIQFCGSLISVCSQYETPQNSWSLDHRVLGKDPLLHPDASFVPIGKSFCEKKIPAVATE